MMLQFDRVVATGTAALDSGIGDLALKTFNGDTYLYSVTGLQGGIAAWRLSGGGAPVLQDRQYFDASIAQQVGRGGTLVTLGAETQLLLDVDTAAGLVSYEVNADGTIGTLQETMGLSGGGDLSAVAQATIGGRDFLSLAHTYSGQMGTYLVASDGSLSLTGLTTGRVDAMQAVQSDGNHFVITADTAGNTIRSYAMDQVNGVLTLTDGAATLQTLGIGAPTDIETVTAYGKSWAIVAGADSNSLSVMAVGGAGTLRATDHVLDTLHTRFESVQDLATIQVDGRVFIVAGGGDDGITLFTMTPDGQLIHMDSFADTTASGLQNVETLRVAHIGDDLQIFAASQQDEGLTQLSVSVADLGIVAQGFGGLGGTSGDDMLKGGILNSNLSGEAGDDILIAGTSVTTMTGGAGADVFVMRESSGATTITDFEAGLDRLDLSDFPFLRSPAQLNFTSTAQGARITYREETIEVTSAQGTSLTEADIFGTGFGGADHIPTDLGSGPDNNASDGVAGLVTIDAGAVNTALTDAEIRFVPDGGAAITAQADHQGMFDLDVPGGSFSGRLDIVKTYSNASSEITALDALQVLRIAVGLEPTWGAATPENLIAADITRDGSVSALDALAILQNAVGLPTPHEAKWVFIDANSDLSGITRNAVNYDTGTDITIVDGNFSTDMTSILLGNIEVI